MRSSKCFPIRSRNESKDRQFERTAAGALCAVLRLISSSKLLKSSMVSRIHVGAMPRSGRISSPLCSRGQQWSTSVDLKVKEKISYLHFAVDEVKERIPSFAPFRQQAVDRSLKYSNSSESSAQAELHITRCLAVLKIVQTEFRNVS